MNVAETITETFENRLDGGERITVRKTNWGEPYAMGIAFEIYNEGKTTTAALLKTEARELYEHLGKLLKLA